MITVSGASDADDPPSGVDLDDVTGCPRGHRCESCGDEHAELTVRTVRTSAGLLCLICAAFDGPPPISVGTATRLVALHLEHLRPRFAPRATPEQPS